MNERGLDALALVMLVFGLSLLVFVWIGATKATTQPSEETRRLCWEYATRNHEKEMSPERWEYLKTLGNPNDIEFFYGSCLTHIMCPVADKVCPMEVKGYME